MKVKTIVSEMYKAIANKDKQAEKELWLKARRKSLKHKKTHAIN
jgi:hypothetical protein